jgi:hypothetical protein
MKNLFWFKDEHDEAPAGVIGRISEIRQLGAELTRRRQGQLVIGRRIDAKEFTSMDRKKLEKLAVSTFSALSPLFNLHAPRVVGKMGTESN